MKLARKFLFAVVSIALVVLTFGVVASLASEVELRKADIARDHALLGHALARLVERIPDDRLAAEAPDILRSALPGEERMHAHLLSTADPQAAPVDRALFEQALSTGTPVVAEEAAGSAVLVTIVPLSTPGMAVELVEPVLEHRQFLQRMALRFVLVTLLLTAGLVIAINGLGSRFIGEPMKLLVSQARRIGAGNLDQPTPLSQDDEVGELARELNAMALRLRESDARARAENEQRLQAVTLLRHADRLATVGTLASGIAHELGTPLAVVQGRATLIDDASADPDVQKSARVITEQVQRMMRIIRQVLDFARRSTPKPARVPLTDIVDKAVLFLSSISKKHAVEIRVASRSPTLVMADPGLMHQVFTNLLMNAVQASSGRGRPVVVRVAETLAAPPGEAAASVRRYGYVEIEDHGEGIPQDQILHVFEPFFTTKDVGEGTGLGLSVAWGIVDDHEGWIDVESKVGEGSSFRVYLPCAGDPAGA